VTNTFVDSLPLLESSVGHGELGLRGSLGYEGKRVSVDGRRYERALSAHPPARLVIETRRQFASFRSTVALNDDVRGWDAFATFLVLADGRLVGVAPHVRAGETAALRADIAGAHTIELVVRTGRWEHCHAVWLDPVASAEPVAVPAAFADCLNRVEIVRPPSLPRARRCIATVVTPRFDALLDDMLGSLFSYGNCRDALIVVFAVDGDDACRRVIEKYGATGIACKALARVNPTVKSVLYSAAHVVDAEQFLCLDADMLVLGDVRPVFGAVEACPEGTLLACREGNTRDGSTLEHAIANVYGGRASDFARILGSVNGEPHYPLIVNDGLFAGGRTALLMLDGIIRGWTGAAGWVDERRDVWWRNQCVFNLALARLNCGVELDSIFNVHLQAQDVEMRRTNGRVEGFWQGRPARVLHFCGWGRTKYPAWRGMFGRRPMTAG
jgi:hypothetical protein